MLPETAPTSHWEVEKGPDRHWGSKRKEKKPDQTTRTAQTDRFHEATSHHGQTVPGPNTSSQDLFKS